MYLLEQIRILVQLVVLAITCHHSFGALVYISGDRTNSAIAHGAEVMATLAFLQGGGFVSASLSETNGEAPDPIGGSNPSCWFIRKLRSRPRRNHRLLS